VCVVVVVVVVVVASLEYMNTFNVSDDFTSAHSFDVDIGETYEIELDGILIPPSVIIPTF
jgi:hypothetical protein